MQNSLVCDGRGNSLMDGQLCMSTEPFSDRLYFPMLELPVHIICEILSRLPLKSILRCKCVCKLFLKLLKDPYFAKIHLAMAPFSTTNLILEENLGIWGSLHFYTFDLSEVALSSCRSDNQSIPCYDPHNFHSLNNLDAAFSFHTQKLTLIGSCNGLLCLYFGTAYKPFYGICNPILGECIKLPSQTSSPPSYVYGEQSGFGYCTGSKQYKVISFMRHLDPLAAPVSERVVAEIHTVSSDSWRRIPGVPRPQRESFDPFLNGNLHWVTISYKPSELIISFDLETEQFKFVPPPSHFTASFVYKLSWINVGVLRDCLCACYIYEDTEFEVWVMREYGVKESWTKEFSIDMKFYCKLRVEDLHRPIKFVSNGDLWFISSCDSLVSFSPSKRTFRELRSMGWKNKISAHDLGFISLKDVSGEKGPKLKNFKLERRRFIFGI